MCGESREKGKTWRILVGGAAWVKEDCEDRAAERNDAQECVQYMPQVCNTVDERFDTVPTKHVHK